MLSHVTKGKVGLKHFPTVPPKLLFPLVRRLGFCRRHLLFTGNDLKDVGAGPQPEKPPEGLPVAKWAVGQAVSDSATQGRAGRTRAWVPNTLSPHAPSRGRAEVSAFRSFSFNRFHLELARQLPEARARQGPRRSGRW